MTGPAALLAAALAALPPPLAHFLAAARARNHALGISRAQLAEQEEAVQQAMAALTPVLQVSGSYTRNQYAAVISLPSNLLGLGPPGALTSLTIQPYNAVTAAAGLSIPIFSAPAWERYAEAKKAREVADASERASDADVLLSTARAYYDVVGAQGVADAAQRSVATARDNLRVTETKLAAGTANRLAVDRARVDVARAEQTVATSNQALALARRNLETLAGEALSGPLAAPDEGTPPPRAEGDLVAEAEGQRAEVVQASAALEQQELALREAWSVLVPSVTGSAQEHYTNAPGFITENEFWTAGASLSWALDPIGMPAAIRRARAAVAEQRERLLQIRDTVRDDVHTAWLEVEADRARRDESRSEVQSAREALAITREQYQAGTATSLDVSQAQRDAFTAEATLAQSQAALAGALLSLQKAAGEPLLAEGNGGRK